MGKNTRIIKGNDIHIRMNVRKKRHTIAHIVRETEDEKEESFPRQKINRVIKKYSSYINAYVYMESIRWYDEPILQNANGVQT